MGRVCLGPTWGERDLSSSNKISARALEPLTQPRSEGLCHPVCLCGRSVSFGGSLACVVMGTPGALVCLTT